MAMMVSIAADDGKIYIDSNGRTMVPLRTLAEAMQFTVSWNAADKSITIVDGPKGIVVFRLVHQNIPLMVVRRRWILLLCLFRQDVLMCHYAM